MVSLISMVSSQASLPLMFSYQHMHDTLQCMNSAVRLTHYNCYSNVQKFYVFQIRFYLLLFYIILCVLCVRTCTVLQNVYVFAEVVHLLRTFIYGFAQCRGLCVVCTDFARQMDCAYVYGFAQVVRLLRVKWLVRMYTDFALYNFCKLIGLHVRIWLFVLSGLCIRIRLLDSFNISVIRS